LAKKKKKIYRGINEVFDAIKRLNQQEIVMDLLDTADVIFCTLTTAGSMPMKRMTKGVDALIIDEASSATEPEILIPLHTSPSRLLLVGDPRQLPPSVMSPKAQECGLARSLQERLMFDNKFHYTMLNVQYRMRKEISQWPSAKFYEGKVSDAENVSNEAYFESHVPLLTGAPYIWIPVSGEEMKDPNKSTYNEKEAEMVVKLLLKLQQEAGYDKEWSSPERVRVITYYHGQVNKLNTLLERYGLGDVTVSTVDSSQGSEANLVILSCVRGTSGHMGFVKDARRLNVSLTRAKFQMIFVGNVHAMAGLREVHGNFLLRNLAEDALDRKCLERGPEDALPKPMRPQKNHP